MSTPEAGLLERLEKLLALATSSNPHEALAAARAAQGLVSKHRLEAWLTPRAEAETDSITDGREAPLEVARRIRKWKQALASALASANASASWVLETPNEMRLCVVGRARDRACVRALYEGLVKRIEWASATAGPRQSRAWHEAFRIGMADAIAPRLAEAEADASAEALAAGTVVESALVRFELDREARRESLERYLAAHFGPGRGRGLLVDARAYARGRAAGAKLILPRR